MVFSRKTTRTAPKAGLAMHQLKKLRSQGEKLSNQKTWKVYPSIFFLARTSKRKETSMWIVAEAVIWTRIKRILSMNEKFKSKVKFGDSKHIDREGMGVIAI